MSLLGLLKDLLWCKRWDWFDQVLGGSGGRSWEWLLLQIRDLFDALDESLRDRLKRFDVDDNVFDLSILLREGCPSLSFAFCAANSHCYKEKLKLIWLW